MITVKNLGLNVSRETLEHLNHYLELLKKWNPKINLVSPATLQSAIDRHFADSAQLATIPKSSLHRWVDLGSGGGFPGLVVSIIFAEFSSETKFTLIESDTRKAAFLRTVIREIGLSATVLAHRIEDAPPQQAEILSARALAPLPKLLDFAGRHLSDTGRALFMKGESWGKEIENAQSQWQFSCARHTSKTNPNAVVLEIGDLVHV